MMRIAIATCVAASAAHAGTTIHLRYASFDPALSMPAVPGSLAAPSGSRVAIVQFARTPGVAERAALESRGCEVLRYIPDHAYVVRTPRGLDAATIPGVRWAGPFHAAYKLDESLLGAAIAPDAGAPVRCGIELLDRGPAPQERLDAALRAAGSRIESFDPLGRRVEALLTPAQLVAAARLDDVHFIDPSGPPGADMDIVRQLSGADYLEAQTGASGEGVRGEVMDNGIDETHPAFQNPPPLLHGANGPSPDCHSASTYGILFTNYPPVPVVRGMIPDREQGIFASRFNVVSLEQHYAELVDPLLPYRGVFQSSSIGGPQTFNYTTISAMIDDALFHVDLAVTQSMSNTGTSTARPEAWAKNIIAVGGINHNDTLTRADDTGSSASTGYAQDGRLKPDVAHVFDSVRTVACGNPPPPPGYTTFSGTSASTPIVAGHVGLLCQAWHEGAFSGFGGGASVFADRPKASTIRALLFNSAYQYDWTLGGPNASITRARQGWGMPDLQGLYDRSAGTFVINETDPILPQGARTYHVTVPPGETAFKATMVYLDPQGNPATPTQHRVNDLTLKVTSPGGVVYWGNWGLTAPTGGPGHGIWSASGGTPDTKNVVENVFVQDPRVGEWTIEVSAPELVMDARLETPELDADFALVVSGVQIDQPCYADCNGVGGLTIADFGCFQTKFVAGDPYADCNGVGGLTIADFGCFQTAFVKGCP